MGQGKKTPDHVVQTVKDTWRQDPSQTATQVYQKIRRASAMCPELRKVQQIIAEARKEDESSERKRPAAWRPWGPKIPPAADVDYLLRLDALNLRARGRNLYQDEAKWARRLRVALEGLDLFDQLWIVWEYYRSERFSRSPNRAWDGVLAYKPWLTDNAVAYECALIAELVPMPPVFTTPEMDERLDLLRRVLEAPDEAALAEYNALPTFWSGLSYNLKPSEYLDDYPAVLNPRGPETEIRTVKSKAIHEVGRFWLSEKTTLQGGQDGR